MENKIPYQFSNEKEILEEVEKCAQENHRTFHERKSKEHKATEEACKIFHNIMLDRYYDRISKQ
jgi:hypothetical protein